jgi:PAS domain S-box-containing protein
MSLSTRLTAAMVLLVAITAAAVGYLSYRTIEETVLPAELTRLDSRARLQAAALDGQVSAARADVIAISKTRALAGIVAASVARAKNPRAPATDPATIERLENLFTVQLQAKPEYAAFRLVGIANNGRELIRVDRSGPDNTPRVATDAELLNKADRNYFKATIGLYQDQVHITPITLNETGMPRTEGPRIPYLRVSTPVFDAGGNVFGFVIINIDMRPKFDEIVKMTGENGRLYVVNDGGDYLVHPDRSREFGFNLGTRYRMQDEFTDLAAAIKGAQAFQGMITSPNKEPAIAAYVPFRLGGGPLLGIVETISVGNAMASAKGVQRATLTGGFLAALLAAGLAVLFARSLARPLTQMSNSLANFTGEEDVAVPVNAKGEIGTLARAFARMARAVRERTAALHSEIAARKKIEERERLYVAAVQSASDAIVTTTLDGTITTWNSGAARLFGYGAAEAVGQSIALIASPEMRDEQVKHANRVKHGKGFEDHETVRRTKDGALRDVSLTFSPISDAGGTLVGASAIYRDIGPRKHQEYLLKERAEELQRSNAELEQFAYVASHDLQEPLRMVASYAELLAERYQGKLDAKADKYIGYAVDGAKRMQRLVNDLLLFSRAGRHEPKSQPTDLNKLVADVLKGLDRAVTSTNARVDVGLLPVVVTDGGQLSQVFQNLIGNAVKFHGETPPVVKIAAEPHGTGWKFSIADNGIGIEEQYSERIFQMFQRLHDRASYDGNGIGLPIAKKIVERQGGRIWFESTPGKGTTFFFTIPLLQEKAA